MARHAWFVIHKARAVCSRCGLVRDGIRINGATLMYHLDPLSPEMRGALARRVGADASCSDDQLPPENNIMNRWIFPTVVGLVVGMVLGACITGFALAFSDPNKPPVRIHIIEPEPQAEPTEAILWSVDVDGDSAP